MDIWERMYEKAKEQYHPEEVSPFIYAHNVVCAIEAENGDIYTGFCIESCCGVMNICADRLAALNMYANRRWERYALWCLSGIPLSIKRSERRYGNHGQL